MSDLESSLDKAVAKLREKMGKCEHNVDAYDCEECAKKSEFGKGLVICLVKFVEHTERLDESLRTYKEIKEKDPTIKYFGEDHAIMMWANGASDHLYEITVPDGNDWNEIRAKVNELKDLGLNMGHGMNYELCTLENAEKCSVLAREIAMLIDIKLGLKPEIGRW